MAKVAKKAKTMKKAPTKKVAKKKTVKKATVKRAVKKTATKRAGPARRTALRGRARALPPAHPQSFAAVLGAGREALSGLARAARMAARERTGAQGRIDAPDPGTARGLIARCRCSSAAAAIEATTTLHRAMNHAMR